jgi:hypothetical protein
MLTEAAWVAARTPGLMREAGGGGACSWMSFRLCPAPRVGGDRSGWSNVKRVLVDRSVSCGGSVHAAGTRLVRELAVLDWESRVSVFFEPYDRAPVSGAYLEAVHECRDDLHAAARRRLERGRLECAIEGPEVADLYPQTSRARRGHEQDAAVRPGPAVPHGVGDRLRRGEHQIPRGLALDAGVGRRLAND